MKEIKLKTIGFVRNNVKEPRFGNFANEISKIVVDKKFTRYNWYMRVRSGLIKAGFKKILNLLDKENFFEINK